MKCISWNVNGLRACIGKGFWDAFDALDADVFCLQEIKLQQGQCEIDRTDYDVYWNYADKKGYSGTAILTRVKPVTVTRDIGIDEHDHEGRVLTAEFERFYLVNCYTPNSQNELKRLDYRMRWEDAFRAYLMRLDEKKPVVLCGDLNVAHEAIDLKNPQSNHKNAGFTDAERGKFSELLSVGFVDSFRHFYPDATGQYSWWSYIRNARATNAGWRIDYFVVSERLRDQLQSASIHQEIYGSDHCPVELIL